MTCPNGAVCGQLELVGKASSDSPPFPTETSGLLSESGCWIGQCRCGENERDWLILCAAPRRDYKHRSSRKLGHVIAERLPCAVGVQWICLVVPNVARTCTSDGSWIPRNVTGNLVRLSDRRAWRTRSKSYVISTCIFGNTYWNGFAARGRVGG